MNLTTLLDNDPRARRRLSLFTTITTLHALGPLLDDTTLAELPLRVEQRGASVHVTLARRSLGSIALHDLD